MALAVALMVLAVPPMPRLLSRTPDLPFPPVGEETVVTLSDLEPGAPFREVIPSWNVKRPAGVSLRIELRAKRNDVPTRWYRMADWSLDPKLAPRRSFEGEKDANGEAQTDTLVLSQDMEAVDVRLTLRSIRPAPEARLSLLTLAFSGGEMPREPEAARSPAWGRVLKVPKRNQGDYPNGGVLCSATSTSMLLAQAQGKVSRVDRDVPDVVAGLWDGQYDGAGNWSFNAAYYGQFPGLTGYVARFASIQELERWIEAGVPVAVSVDYNRLKGTPKAQTSGHLVVLVGFTKEGDPVFNDPAVRKEVRTTYRRADFDAAWRQSGRTVYVFHADEVPTPPSTGRWR